MDELPRKEKSSKFDAADFAVGSVCGLVAIPICDASWHAIVVEHEAMTRGIIGLCFGLPIGLGGFSFHWWKDKTPGFRDWLTAIAKRWWPAAVGLVFLYVSGPDIYRRSMTADAAVQKFPSADEIATAVVKVLPAQPQNGGMFNEAIPKPPSPPRSKQTINELLEESGTIQSAIERGPPLNNEWREMITTQNPERVCLDLDSRALQDKITTFANKVRAPGKQITAVISQNQIDEPELSKLLDGNEAGFELAALALESYQRSIAQLGDHPTCEILIRIGNVPTMFMAMNDSLNTFSIWLARAQNNIAQYRAELRKELRNAP